MHARGADILIFLNGAGGGCGDRLRRLLLECFRIIETDSLDVDTPGWIGRRGLFTRAAMASVVSLTAHAFIAHAEDEMPGVYESFRTAVGLMVLPSAYQWAQRMLRRAVAARRGPTWQNFPDEPMDPLIAMHAAVLLHGLRGELDKYWISESARRELIWADHEASRALLETREELLVLQASQCLVVNPRVSFNDTVTVAGDKSEGEHDTPEDQDTTGERDGGEGDVHSALDKRD